MDLKCDSAIIDQFCDHLAEDEKAANTIRHYRQSVEVYFSMFDQVTKQNMIAYKKHLIDTAKPKTAAGRCIAMNQFCKFIGKPECAVKTVKVPKKLSADDVPTEEEYRRFIQCLEHDGLYKWSWLVQFIAKTGARVSEIERFEKKHLEVGQAEFWSKGKIRRILIPAKLIEDSRGYFDDFFQKNPNCKWLFPNRYGNQLSHEAVREMLKRYGRRYGLREEILHPHAFRHFFAVQFLKTNKDLTLLADLMGHESVDTTAIYLRLSAKEQRAQLDDAMDW